MINAKKILLPFVVFLTGACVLIIEVVATRILSPYFGNTIFTVSSIISVVLAALSIGYYVGGRVADRYPNETFFYGLITLSGVATILMYALQLIALPFVGYSLTLMSGPLVMALLLFFLPSFMLGMLSPFSVKLQALQYPHKGAGSVAGDIFFWSTAGSIAGSLSAGFVLIPHLGVNRIVEIVAAVLIVVGGANLIRLRAQKKTFVKLGLVVAVTVGLHFLSLLGNAGTVYSHDGVYEKLTIYDTTYRGRPARFLLQDRSNSGAMFLDNPELAFDYTKYISLYRLFTPHATRVLALGGGAYSIPKAVLEKIPSSTVDVTEIEPRLFDLSKKYFAVPSTPRLTNFVVDGRRFVHDTPHRYDIIFSDVYYSLYSIPTHFTTQEFFAAAKQKLAPGGIFMANLIGSLSRSDPSFLMSEIKTFRSVFPNSYFFAVDSPTSTRAQNIIFVGYNSTSTINFSAPTVLQSTDPLIAGLSAHRIDPDRFDLSATPLFTDNYAPVEYFLSPLLTEDELTEHDTIEGNEMLGIIKKQLSFGPRYLSAPGHAEEQKFIVTELRALGVSTSVQQFDYTDAQGYVFHLQNIIGRLNPTNTSRIMLATHYDSMRYAKFDKRNYLVSPPGANNSASGVAMLLEIARYLSTHPTTPPYGIDLVFFDGEEGDEIASLPTSSWALWQPLGSQYFSRHLSEYYSTVLPSFGIVLDVVCGKNDRVNIEDPRSGGAVTLASAFSKYANSEFPHIFSGRAAGEIFDDHTTLTTAGIPSILLINGSYSFLDTPRDTIDQCSSESIETVGKNVVDFIGRSF